jgi:hypothetical protein
VTTTSSLGAVAEGRRLTYLSLGAGVQSSALYVMTTLGLHGCPRADVAIFADTQCEPQYVYDYLAVLRVWGMEHGGPRIDTVTAGALAVDYLAGTRDSRSGSKRKGVSAIPAYAEQPDGRARMLMRHCTTDYKVVPIERHVRQLLGLRKGQRSKGYKAMALIGISLDEAARMRVSKASYVENRYPLVDARLKRKDCLSIVRDAGLPEPSKSACAMCPFHDDAYWLELKRLHPESFEYAAQFDDAIRDQRHTGVMGKVYLHRTLQPLRTIDFAERRRLPLFESDQFQNECEGMCGV